MSEKAKINEPAEEIATNTAGEETIWKEESETKEQTEVKNSFAAKPVAAKAGILTIDPDDTVQIMDEEKILWHDLNTAMRKRRILRGTINEVTKTENGMSVIATHYKGQRITIPLDQMEIHLSNDEKHKGTPDEVRRYQLATVMMGSEFDYIIKHIDEKNRIVLASRKEAIIENIKKFYATLDENRVSMVGNCPDVQARIIAVTDKSVTAEVFGIQTQINANEIFYEWTANLRERFAVGDKFLVRVLDIDYPEPFDGCENNEEWLLGIQIKATHKPFEIDKPRINFENHRIDSTSSAIITDIRNGTYYLSLIESKVNARAHVVKTRQKLMIGDTVRYKCNKKYEDTCISEGVITSLIKAKY